MIFDLPDMSVARIREYNNKLLADMQSDPPMVELHDRERQAHAVIHHLLDLIEQGNTHG